MILNKGAMFGLDARIALAIFGALSVISGAALYSAIQQSKIIALVNQLNEAAKAVESFRIDTGQDLPESGSAGILMAQNLVESSVDGANVPYTSLAKYPTISHYLEHDGSAVGVYKREGATWATGTYGTACTVAPCMIWVSIVNAHTLEEYEKIDEYVDGTVDLTSGRLRGYYNTGAKYNIYLQVGPSLVQP